MPTCEVVLYELHLYRAKHGRAMHNGRPEQRKFDASQGNSAAQLATTMVSGRRHTYVSSKHSFLLPVFAQL
jgi:hypothetical protein